MKGVLRRGVSALCALFLVLGTAACQQKEPKMKDGKIKSPCLCCGPKSWW